MPAKLVVPAFALGAMIIASLAACGSESGGPGAPSSTAVTTTTTATATTTTTATASATGSPIPAPATASSATSSGGAASLANCRVDQLAVTGATIGGATGHSGLVLRFRNTSGAACALVGYPGVAGVAPSGQQFEQARRTTRGFLGGAPDRRVTVAAGGTASALLEGTANAGDCSRGNAVLVTPPNTATSTKLPFRDYFCDLQIHPVVAGTGGGAG